MMIIIIVAIIVILMVIITIVGGIAIKIMIIAIIAKVEKAGSLWPTGVFGESLLAVAHTGVDARALADLTTSR